MVEYLALDVTASAQALQKELAGPVERLGKINGLLHGAGTLADRRIEKKTIRDFETVFNPKVDGLGNLLQVAPPAQLDFLVLFLIRGWFFRQYRPGGLCHGQRSA